MCQFIGDRSRIESKPIRRAGWGPVPVVAQRWRTWKRHLQAWSVGARFLGIEGIVFQRQLNDCGPSALQMVLRRFFVPAAGEQVERLARLKPQGTTLRSLGRAAEALGLRAYPWVLRSCDLQRVSLPVLAWLKRGHYVVIDQVLESGSLVVLDPAVGRLLFTSRALWKQWNGEALLFSLPEPERPRPFGRPA